MLNQVAGTLKVSNIHDLPQRAATVSAELKNVQKELDDLKAQIANAKVDGLFEDAQEVEGIKIFTLYLTRTANDAVRGMCDKARDKVPASVTAIIGECDGKISLAVAVGRRHRPKVLPPESWSSRLLPLRAATVAESPILQWPALKSLPRSTTR